MRKTSNILTENSETEFTNVEFAEIQDYEYTEQEPLKKERAVKELTDEIKQFRAKKKEFDATNDHQTYLVVVFSTKEDKELFKNSVGIADHTFVDGYQLAELIGHQPQKPKFKLAKTISPNTGKR